MCVKKVMSANTGLLSVCNRANSRHSKFFYFPLKRGGLVMLLVQLSMFSYVYCICNKACIIFFRNMFLIIYVEILTTVKSEPCSGGFFSGSSDASSS